MIPAAWSRMMANASRSVLVCFAQSRRRYRAATSTPKSTMVCQRSPTMAGSHPALLLLQLTEFREHLFGSLEVPAISVDLSKVVQRLGVVGIEFGGTFQERLRLFVAILAQETHAEPKVGLG